MRRLFLLLSISLLCGMKLVAAVNGDVDGNGVVNGSDITALYNYLLSSVTPGCNADVDGNGTINGSDITALYNILLSPEDFGEHEYVDLGLPSGTLWATMNVGAESPERYGFYFAWGETIPKETYDWSTYKWCNGSYDTLTKYCTNSSYGYNGYIDNTTWLNPEDDAATANWGPEWCMPSLGQILELCDNCSSQWTTRNGVNGRLFTSNLNGASLFLPAAGHRFGSELYNAGSYGYVWSRTLTPYPNNASGLSFSSGHDLWDNSTRELGSSVRAVRVSQN